MIRFDTRDKKPKLYDLAVITAIFAAVYLYFECMLIGAIIANVIVVRYEPEKDKDYLIILGCGLKKDGSPHSPSKGACRPRDRVLRKAEDRDRKGRFLCERYR